MMTDDLFLLEDSLNSMESSIASSLLQVRSAIDNYNVSLPTHITKKAIRRLVNTHKVMLRNVRRKRKIRKLQKIEPHNPLKEQQKRKTMIKKKRLEIEKLKK